MCKICDKWITKNTKVDIDLSAKEVDIECTGPLFSVNYIRSRMGLAHITSSYIPPLVQQAEQKRLDTNNRLGLNNV